MLPGQALCVCPFGLCIENDRYHLIIGLAAQTHTHTCHVPAHTKSQSILSIIELFCFNKITVARSVYEQNYHTVGWEVFLFSIQIKCSTNWEPILKFEWIMISPKIIFKSFGGPNWIKSNYTQHTAYIMLHVTCTSQTDIYSTNDAWHLSKLIQ